MSGEHSGTGISRRRFLANTTAAGMAMAACGKTALGASLGREPSPFGYDVSGLSKTDPKWLRYEEVARWPSPYPEPRRIAVDAEDRLYVAAGNFVTVLDAKGNRLRELALPDKARCVAVAGDGMVYAGVRDHIEVFDSKGQRRAVWETPGKKVWFTGMAAAESAVFAADAGNRVVWRYDRSGKALGRIGEKDKQKNVPGLIVPSPYLDVALGRDGLLRVGNPGRHQVELYTTDGEFELSWGKAGAAIQHFCGCCNPVAVAMLPDGRCVTCEKGLPRAKVFDTDGSFECVVAGPESFPANARAGSARDLSDGTMGGLDAAVDAKGRVYVLDVVAADVRVMSRKAGV